MKMGLKIEGQNWKQKVESCTKTDLSKILKWFMDQPQNGHSLIEKER